MFQFKTLSASCALALAFCALPLAANAAGSFGPAAQNYSGGSSNYAAAQYANAYGPAGVGNVINTNSLGNESVSNSVSVSGPTTGTINVQTNIDNTKTIESSSAINVTNTVNGYNVAFGLNGAQSLNVIDNASGADAAVSDAYTGMAGDIESDALAVANEMEQAQ